MANALNHGHTDADHEALTRAGVDPATTQPREHSVPCQTCRTATFNKAAHCDVHYVAPAAAERLAVAA